LETTKEKYVSMVSPFTVRDGEFGPATDVAVGQ
jgi:hypothetical protein